MIMIIRRRRRPRDGRDREMRDTRPAGTHHYCCVNSFSLRVVRRRRRRHTTRNAHGGGGGGDDGSGTFALSWLATTVRKVIRGFSRRRAPGFYTAATCILSSPTTDPYKPTPRPPSFASCSPTPTIGLASLFPLTTHPWRPGEKLGPSHPAHQHITTTAAAMFARDEWWWWCFSLSIPAPHTYVCKFYEHIYTHTHTFTRGRSDRWRTL